MTVKRSHYFDYAASWPMLPEALAAYTASAGVFGNASSVHGAGTACRDIVERSRREICDCVNFPDGRLVFTSGGTEANNLVVMGHLLSVRKARFLIAQDVHPSIWFVAEQFPERVTVLPLGDEGKITARDVESALKPDTTMLCMNHVCNETGTVHDAVGVAEFCARRGVLCHVDGVQAAGHIPVDLANMPCDYYTFSAHKFGACHGVGGVFLRGPAPAPILRGGPQEWELRAGTLNTAGVACAAAALKLCCARMVNEAPRLRGLARSFLGKVLAGHPDVLVNTSVEVDVPGLVSISVPGLSSTTAAFELSLRGFAVATGSACHADSVDPSRVILARGRSREEALGTLRISMGYASTGEGVEALAEAVMDVISGQRIQE